MLARWSFSQGDDMGRAVLRSANHPGALARCEIFVSLFSCGNRKRTGIFPGESGEGDRGGRKERIGKGRASPVFVRAWLQRGIPLGRVFLGGMSIFLVLTVGYAALAVGVFLLSAREDGRAGQKRSLPGRRARSGISSARPGHATTVLAPELFGAGGWRVMVATLATAGGGQA